MKILICLLLFNIIAFGQINKDSNVVKKPIENIITNSSDTINEKNVYKLLFEETKQTNDRLVNTVLWALGGVVTLALLLIGYNVLYNFKINRDQIISINKEVDIKIDKIRNEDVSSLNDKLEDNKQEYDEKLNQKYLSLNVELDYKIAALTKTYEKQTDAYKVSTELQVKTLEKSIDERVNNSNESLDILKNRVKDLDTKFSELINDFKEEQEIQIRILKYKSDFSFGLFWKDKNIPINALTFFIDALETENQMKSSISACGDMIDETLDQLKEIPIQKKEKLIKHIKESTHIKNELVNTLMEKINKLIVT